MHKPSKYSSDVTQSGVDGGTVAKNVRESESVALDDAVNARLKMSTWAFIQKDEIVEKNQKKQ